MPESSENPFVSWIRRFKPAIYGCLGRCFGYRSHFCYKVRLTWMMRLRRRRLFSWRPCIGFGPILHVERQLAGRKWEIDPYVDYINAHSDRYDADIFFEDTDADFERFDAIVLVKEFDFLGPERIRALKDSGKKLLFNTSDNIVHPRNYLTEKWFMEMVDGFIAENPLTFEDLQAYPVPSIYLPTPIISRRFKTDYRERDEVRIIWEGYRENLSVEKFFNPLVQRLNRELEVPVRILYHTNDPSRREGFVEYVNWEIANWETLRLTADIGVALKDPEDFRKQRKPGAKVQTYMASGLPVVCTPSRADEELIEQGKTGFFAQSEEEWFEHLSALVQSAALREQVGRAARQSVIERYSVEVLGREHLKLLEKVMTADPQPEMVPA